MKSVQLVKNIFTLDKRSSAGSINLFRLIFQILPRYFLKSGFSFPPLSVFLIVNSKCNLKCKICDVGQGNAESIFYKNLVDPSCAEMSFENYQRIINSFDRDTFISITSTEPLLWGPLIPAIEWTVKKGRKVNVTTNGFILPALAEKLVGAGLTRITISLDGPQQVHNLERGNDLSYQKAIEGINKLIGYKKESLSRSPEIIINTVVSPINQGQICRFLEGLPLKDINHVNIELMNFCTEEIAKTHNQKFGIMFPASQTCLKGGVNLDSIDVDLILKDLKKSRKKFNKKIIIRFPLDKEILNNYFGIPEKFLTSARCIFPYFTAQITASGDLIGLSRCYPVSFGNVLKDGFKQTWNSEKMRAFRVFLNHRERMPACSRCEGVLYDL